MERSGAGGGGTTSSSGTKWAELELGALPWTPSQSPKPPLPLHSAKPRAKLLMPLDFVPIVLALLIDQKFYILWTI